MMKGLTVDTVLTAALMLAFAGHAFAAASEQPPPQSAFYPAPKAVKAPLLDIAPVEGGYVAVGDHGVILRGSADSESEQGALAWDQVRSPVSVMLNRVALADQRHGWAVGHDGVILRTDDAGATWALQFRDASGGQAFYDVHADSARQAIVVGSGRAMRTRDGGESWQPLTGDLFDLSWNFNAVTRLANGCLMIAGERGILARSCDDGSSWTQLASPYIGSYYGVLPYGADGAVVYGMRSNVYVTRAVRNATSVDSGSWDPYMAETVTSASRLEEMGWRKVGMPVERGLFDAIRVDDEQVIFVGVASNILVGRLDTGAFKVLPNNSNAPISGVARHDPYLLIVGRGGVRQVRYQDDNGDAARE